MGCEGRMLAALMVATTALLTACGEEATFPPRIELSTLDGTNGFVMNGVEVSDHSARCVSGAGDVNDDGVDDVVIGAALAGPDDRRAAGESYIVFGSRDRFPTAFELSSLDGKNGFTMVGAEKQDQAGLYVSGAGDVNGDGIDDVMIGAPAASPHGIVRAGKSYVVFGSSAGFPPRLELAALDGKNGFALNGIDLEEASGLRVSGAGDVNGDQIADVIIGAPSAAPDDKRLAGRCYVLFGSRDEFPAVLELASLDGTNGFALNGIDAGDRAGRAVSGAGDFNGDGIDDMIIGASAADVGRYPNAGESYVVFGSVSGFPAALELSSLDGTTGIVLSGVENNGHSGYAVSSAGDVNSDGIDDVIVGAFARDLLDQGEGEAYVVFGRSAGLPASFSLSSLDGTNGFALQGTAKGDKAGRSVSGAGDVNGDEIDDVIVGASAADPGGVFDAGEAYVIFGTRSGFPASLKLSSLDGTDGFILTGNEDRGKVGRSVSSAGDFNGDGADDVIMASFQGSPEGRPRAGRSYLFFGGQP